jgi:hypothetical protein
MPFEVPIARGSVLMKSRQWCFVSVCVIIWVIVTVTLDVGASLFSCVVGSNVVVIIVGGLIVSIEISDLLVKL